MKTRRFLVLIVLYCLCSLLQQLIFEFRSMVNTATHNDNDNDNDAIVADKHPWPFQQHSSSHQRKRQLPLVAIQEMKLQEMMTAHKIKNRFVRENHVNVIGRPQDEAASPTVSNVMIADLVEEYHVPNVCVTRSIHSMQCKLLKCANNDTNTVLSSGSHFQIQHSNNTKSTKVQQFQPRGCVISHQYRFVYVHVLKSGGMTMKNFLKRALCGSHRLPCERGSDWIQVGPCAQILRTYPDYFVWSVVRNPYSRLYSQYAMALAIPRGKMGHDQKTQGAPTRATHIAKIEKLLARDHHKRLVRKTDRKHRHLLVTSNESNYSFEQFVLHRNKRAQFSRLHAAHYWPQAAFLFDVNECPVVDYICRLEHMEQHLPFLLGRIGSPELKEYVRAHNGRIDHQMDTAYGKAKRENEQKPLRDYFNDEMIQSAIQEFESDFRLLGYDPNFLPE